MTIQTVLAELRGERDRISSAIAALESLDGTRRTGESAPVKRKVSAVSRRRMAQAQRARWAKVKGQAKSATRLRLAETGKKRSRISPAGLARIRAAARARWAKVRAAKTKTAKA